MKQRWKAPQWKSEMDFGDGVLTFSVKEKKDRKSKKNNNNNNNNSDDDIMVELEEDGAPIFEKSFGTKFKDEFVGKGDPSSTGTSDRRAAYRVSLSQSERSLTLEELDGSRSSLFPIKRPSDIPTPDGVNTKKPWLKSDSALEQNSHCSSKWVFGEEQTRKEEQQQQAPTEVAPVVTTVASTTGHTRKRSLDLACLENNDDDIDDALAALQSFTFSSKSTGDLAGHITPQNNSPLSADDKENDATKSSDTQDDGAAPLSEQHNNNDNNTNKNNSNENKHNSNNGQQQPRIHPFVIKPSSSTSGEQQDDSVGFDTLSTTSSSVSDGKFEEQSNTPVTAPSSPWLIRQSRARQETIAEDKAFEMTIHDDLHGVTGTTATHDDGLDDTTFVAGYANGRLSDSDDNTVQSNEDLCHLLRVPGMGSTSLSVDDASHAGSMHVTQEDFEDLYGNEGYDYYGPSMNGGENIVVECTCYRMRNEPKARKKKKIVYNLKNFRHKTKRGYQKARDTLYGSKGGSTSKSVGGESADGSSSNGKTSV